MRQFPHKKRHVTDLSRLEFNVEPEYTKLVHIKVSANT